MEDRSALTGIEASTSGIKVMMTGLSLFPSVAEKILTQRGLLAPGAKADAIVERWFPLQTWLAVHDAVGREIGRNALFTLGERILANPKYPSRIKDLEGALLALDVAYHKSHRKLGVVMYDDATGHMLEGIGHYMVIKLPRREVFEVTCDTPYSCEVDHGIITGASRRFEPKARVEHKLGTCRSKGSVTCTYVVDW